MIDTSATSLALAALAAWLVGLSKGGVPSIAMLSVPLLSTSMSPLTAAALLLPIYIASDAVGLWLYRRSFSARHLVLLIPAALLGIGLGWATAAMLPDRAVAALIGLLGIGHCLNQWLGPRLRAWRARSASNAAHAGDHGPAANGAPPLRPLAGWCWGALCGLTSFIAHAGGPPFQIYMLSQKLDKLRFAGTSTLLFAVVNLAKLVPYQQLRPYDLQGLQTAAWLLPPALLGTVMGAWLTRRMPEVGYFGLVQIGLFAVSIQLLLQAWG